MQPRGIRARVAPAVLALVTTAAHADDAPLWTWSGTTAGELFGVAVDAAGDVDGDGLADVAVGAWSYDRGAGIDVGRVYVISGASGVLRKVIDGETFADEFGAAVAGDFDADADGTADLAVGAPGYESDEGAAYVYSTGADTLLWKAAGASALGRLGAAVAAAGDVDGDGRDDLVVAAPSLGGDGGTVTLHSGADGAVLRRWSGPTGFERFGHALWARDDIDGDGVSDVVIGAPGAPWGSDRGRSYVYSGATGTLLQVRQGSATGDRFGESVGAGDIDGDGVADIAVGAPLALGGRGGVRVYSGVTGLPIAALAGVVAGDRFGADLSAAGDFDGDGTDDLAVGAEWHAGDGGDFSGRAYLVSGDDGRLLWTRDGAGSADYLGSALALVGDTNGDGLADVAVGAWGHDALSGVDAGIVYLDAGRSGSTLEAAGSCVAACPDATVVLRLTGLAPTGPATVRVELVEPEEVLLDTFDVAPGPFDTVRRVTYAASSCPTTLRLRASLSSGDATSATAEVVVDAFAPIESTPHGDGGEPAELLLMWEGGEESALGTAVAGGADIDGDGVPDLLVGSASFDTVDAFNVGAAYAYSGADGTLVRSWVGEGGGHGFGRLAFAGEVDGDSVADIVIAAPAYGDTGSFEGKVYVYSGVSGELIWSWVGDTGGAKMGTAVAGAGDTDGDGFADIIVGAPDHGAGLGGETGVAYLYSGGSGELLGLWSGACRDAKLGASVAAAGDLNGDGRGDVAIGVPGGCASAGQVDIRAGGSGQLLQILSTGEGRGFGQSVAGAGDVDLDGRPDLLVARTDEVAYLFSGLSFEVIQSWQSDELFGDFGTPVAAAGDVNGDGVPDHAFGAREEDGAAGFGTGRVYVYAGGADELIWSVEGEAASAAMGDAVAAAGDIDGDGVDDVIVGSWSYDGSEGEDQGRAYVYAGRPGFSLRAEATCLAECPGGSLVTRFQGYNTADGNATLSVRLVEPAVTLLELVMPTGRIDRVERFDLPPSWPPAESCPRVLTLEATLSDGEALTATTTFTTTLVGVDGP